MKKYLSSLITYLAHPHILFFTFPWLIFLLAIGSIAQGKIGLYQAHKIYFSSFYFWYGFLPLPGMYSVLIVLSFSLLAKIIAKSPWTLKRSGVFITHLAVFFLLAGGGLTSLLSEEGSVVLGINEKKSAVSDYHDREMVVFKNRKPVFSFPFEAISENEKIIRAGLPFEIFITKKCRNCDFQTRTGNDKRYIGLAEKITLQKTGLKPEDEENRSGMEFEIYFPDKKESAYYATFETPPVNDVISAGSDGYTVIVQKTLRDLPFIVELKQFEKDIYPGTITPRNYSSAVVIHDGDAEFPATISMNRPLRYKGYTLYQSSYIEAENQTRSVLAVVKNAGRVFPYVTGLLLCIGLLTHLAVSAPKNDPQGKKS